MEKIAKKKNANPMMPLNCEIEEMRVPMSTFIEGMVAKLLRGLSNLNVRNTFTPPIPGKDSSKDVTTTMKSNQFQASLR